MDLSISAVWPHEDLFCKYCFKSQTYSNKEKHVGTKICWPFLKCNSSTLIHWNDTWESPRTHLNPFQIFIKDSYTYCILHLDAIKVMFLSMNWMSAFISTNGMIKCSGWCTLRETSFFFIFTTNYWDHLQSLKVVLIR